MREVIDKAVNKMEEFIEQHYTLLTTLFAIAAIITIVEFIGRISKKVSIISSAFKNICIIVPALCNFIVSLKLKAIQDKRRDDFNHRYDRLPNESDADYNKRITELEFGKKK